jgi:hypothetical protein
MDGMRRWETDSRTGSSPKTNMSAAQLPMDAISQNRTCGRPGKDIEALVKGSKKRRTPPARLG